MSRIKNWRKSAFAFPLLFVGLYLVFYWFNIVFIGVTSKGGIYVAFLDQHFNYINWWRSFYINTTAKLLQINGYTVFTSTYRLRVQNAHAITLVFDCLGYAIVSAFSAFVIAYPKPLWAKIKFWIFGMVMINLLNISRFAFLCLYWSRNEKFLDMDHHTAFNIFIYVFLAFAVYIWINYFNKDDKNATQKSF